MIQEADGITLVLSDLLGGTYSKSLEVGRGTTHEVKIHEFIKDQEFGKDLPKQKPEKLKTFSGHWWWNSED